MMESLRLSVGLFTVLPVAPRGDYAPNGRQLRAAILLAPFVGLLLGLAAAGVLFGLRQLFPATGSASSQPLTSLLAASLTIGFLVLLTGGMHWDGLADTVDGMAGGSDSDGTLAVMRRSDIGPMGVLAVLFAVLAQVAALAVSVDHGHGTIAIVAAVVAGRLAAVWACRLPAARPEGLGAWVAGNVGTGQALAVTAASMLVPLLLLVRDDDPRRAALPFVLGAIPMALLAAGALQLWWRRRIGGITGDTIGASVEIATTVALLTVALAP